MACRCKKIIVLIISFLKVSFIYLRRITMPQAIIGAVVMQVVQAVVQKVIEAVTDALKQNQSQPEMEQTAKKTMEDDGYHDRDQQFDILNQASEHAMNQGKMMESVVLSAAAKALGGMALS
jgi:hypothetical protein